MIKKDDFAERLREAIDAVVSAKPGEIEARLKELQKVMDGDLPLIEEIQDDVNVETRYLLESAQIFMNVFAGKAQELRRANRISEAKVLERFMARYTKFADPDGFAGWTDTLYRRNGEENE